DPVRGEIAVADRLAAAVALAGAGLPAAVLARARITRILQGGRGRGRAVHRLDAAGEHRRADRLCDAAARAGRRVVPSHVLAPKPAEHVEHTRLEAESCSNPAGACGARLAWLVIVAHLI